MDLQEIYDYSFEQWGEDQAEAYIQYLFHVFQLLTDRPYMARLRPEIRPSIRSFAARSHVVLFVETETGIGIARILHVAMDIDHAPLGVPFPDQV